MSDSERKELLNKIINENVTDVNLQIFLQTELSKKGLI